ncbi:MAG: SLC13 family permease, partial [Myxococcota bacterium]
MALAAWLSIAVTVLVVLALAFSIAAPERVLMSAVTMLLFAGILTPKSLSESLGSPAVLAVAALLVVARGIRQTGMLAIAVDRLFGRQPRREPLLRLTLPAAALSAFLNNTPLVAIFAPALIDWCKRTGIAPSRMLIPLSYAVILGGMTTLIGTSATLVVDGLMRQYGLAGLGLFEISAVGVPAALGGVLLVSLLAPRLLPER